MSHPTGNTLTQWEADRCGLGVEIAGTCVGSSTCGANGQPTADTVQEHERTVLGADLLDHGIDDADTDLPDALDTAQDVADTLECTEFPKLLVVEPVGVSQCAGVAVAFPERLLKSHRDGFDVHMRIIA